MAEPGRECGRLTPGSGGAHPVLLPGPKVWVPVLAPPQSSYVTARRLLSLSLLICKMDGLDKWGASGAATGKSRTSGVPSDTGVKKERALLTTLGYSLCGLLATHRVLLSFWTQALTVLWENWSSPTLHRVLPWSPPQPRLQVDRYPVSKHSQASVTGSGLNLGQ